MRVKICGITNQKDALDSVKAGAWALGFIFYKKSARYVSPSRAAKIIKSLPPLVTAVGVFVNQKQGAIEDIARFCRLGAIQLHGDEPPLLCSRLKKRHKVIKAFRVSDKFSLKDISKQDSDAYLFDTYREGEFGGSGTTFNWNLLKDLKGVKKPVILSGGLNPNNVKEAIATVQPFAVDVASGVEKSPGQKDEFLVRKFIEEVNRVENRI